MDILIKKYFENNLYLIINSHLNFYYLKINLLNLSFSSNNQFNILQNSMLEIWIYEKCIKGHFCDVNTLQLD